MGTHTFRLGLALVTAALAGSAAAAAALATGGAPSTPVDTNPNRGFYATDADGNLLTFSALAPELATAKPITGLPAGVALRGIDTRPATGDLYGVGSDSVVYRINPATAIAIAEGPMFRLLRGNYQGFDFNPVVDLIRVVSSSRQNIRLNPDAGSLFAIDTAITPVESVVVGSAYTQSSFSATRPTQTTLYALDVISDSLCRQDPPNNGTLTGCRELSIHVRTNSGFDIAGSSAQVGYVATRGGSGGAGLYRVDLASGSVQDLGQVGDGTTVTGLAAVQDQP